MRFTPGWRVDAMQILTMREIAAVLAGLHRKATRSANARMNLVIVRLARWCASQRLPACSWPTFELVSASRISSYGPRSPSAVVDVRFRRGSVPRTGSHTRHSNDELF